MTTPAPRGLRAHFEAYWGGALGAFLWAAHALAAARRRATGGSP